MPHLETASLGVWVNAGARDRAPREHGIAHFLEHMAFKGTRRARRVQIAEEIEAVGGDLNAATGSETTDYYARVLREDVALALDILADILPTRCLRAELVREQEVIAAGDRRGRRFARRSRVRAGPGRRLSRSSRSGRPILGTAQTVRSFDGGRLAAYLRRDYSRAGYRARRGRRGRSRGRGGGSGAAVRELQRSRRSGGGAGKLRRRHARRATRPRTSARGARAAGLVPNRSGTGIAAGFYQCPGRRHVVPAVPGSAREAGPVLFDLFVPMAYSDVGMFGLYAGTDAADTSELMRVIVEEIASTAETISETEIARSKAQVEAGLLMALESSGERIGQLARQMIVHGRLDSDRGIGGGGRGRCRSTALAPQGVRSWRAGETATAVLGTGTGLKGRLRLPRFSHLMPDWREPAAHPWGKSGPTSLDRACFPPSREGAQTGIAAEPSMAFFHAHQFYRPGAVNSRGWDRAAPAANDGLWRVVGAAESEPRLSHALGADLAGRRPDPQRVSAPRSGVTRRISRADQAYPFVIVRAADGALVGGMTLANIRRGVAQAGSLGYWMGLPFVRERPHDGGGPRDHSVRVRHAAAASPRGRVHSDQCGIDPASGKKRLYAGGLCAGISVH